MPTTIAAVFKLRLSTRSQIPTGDDAPPERPGRPHAVSLGALFGWSTRR
jgi:hypothetical protein